MRLLQHIFFIAIIVFYSDVNYAIDDTPSTDPTPSTDKLVIDIVNTLIETAPVEKKTTKELYKLSKQQPIWTDDKAIKAALKLLGNAHRKGLRNKDYKVEWLKTKWAFLKAAKISSFHQLALFESTLSSSVLHYYSDTRYGRIRTKRVGAFLKQDKKVPEFTKKIWETIQRKEFSELEKNGNLHFFCMKI